MLGPRCLYIKYMLQLHMYFSLFTYPMEWRYDYNNASDGDVLRLMAALLANRDGNVQQFALRWARIKDHYFGKRANISDLESLFIRRLKLNIPHGL